MTEEYTIGELEKKIGYQFRDKSLLKQALTHSSFANEQRINKLKDYERLEFLGDAVLELISSDFLFHENPQMPEGKLTKLRSSMVCEPALAYCARDIELGRYMLLGKGEEATGGRNRDSITSDVMEAVIGALYLDGGFDAAHDFIQRFILSDLENKILFYDSKTVLQEILQCVEKPDLGAGGVAFYDGTEEKPADIEAEVFYNAVTKGTPLTVEPEQALVVTQLLEAIYESAKTGKTIYFD